ncbi:MAG: uracil-DNA glycosylase, partial [Actinobacteria bacterium]|nr:uracil-DNA glycosylase [Actinomycetota bacterium]
AGNPDADLLFVGEAPGANEDRTGLPFMGQAGTLLDELLAGIGVTREQVFIANVLKCRPPGNRDPRPDEIDSCRGYLEEQVALIRPRVVCTLGNFATKLLSGRPEGISTMHGQPLPIEFAGVPVTLYPVYHPAAALYTRAMLGSLQDDFARLPALVAGADPGDTASEVPEPVRAPAARGAQAGQAARETSTEQLGLF